METYTSGIFFLCGTAHGLLWAAGLFFVWRRYFGGVSARASAAAPASESLDDITPQEIEHISATKKLDLDELLALSGRAQTGVSLEAGELPSDTPPARRPAVRLVTPRRVSPLRKQPEEPEKPEDEEGWF
jgi:hypothetical protein